MTKLQFLSSVDPVILERLREKVKAIAKLATGTAGHQSAQTKQADAAVNAALQQHESVATVDSLLISRRDARKAASEMMTSAASEADEVIAARMDAMAVAPSPPAGAEGKPRGKPKLKRRATVGARALGS
jgi:hypothetical protein